METVQAYFGLSILMKIECETGVMGFAMDTLIIKDRIAWIELEFGQKGKALLGRIAGGYSADR